MLFSTEHGWGADSLQGPLTLAMMLRSASQMLTGVTTAVHPSSFYSIPNGMSQLELLGLLFSRII